MYGRKNATVKISYCIRERKPIAYVFCLRCTRVNNQVHAFAVKYKKSCLLGKRRTYYSAHCN